MEPTNAWEQWREVRTAETATGPGAVAFRHVDVFADAPFRGNGLIVVFCTRLDYPADRLRVVTEEMRQFETIFVAAINGTTEVAARVFTVDEELPFAGHPVIGAAAALHERLVPGSARVDWQFVIHDRPVPVVTRRDDVYYAAAMDQGTPSLSPPLPEREREEFAAALDLTEADIAPLPLQVISTGLPYLIVPVTGAGLTRARIVIADFEARLAGIGAKFVYVLDTDHSEGRTWDNAGVVEDVATGSAAGPAAAYLQAHALATPGEAVHLQQGRFVGRPSSITVTRHRDGHLWVGGPVRPVASGWLDTLPARSTGD